MINALKCNYKQGKKEATQMVEELNKKEIRDQIEYIRNFLEEHQEDWYVYSTLRDELHQLEIIFKREHII